MLFDYFVAIKKEVPSRIFELGAYDNSIILRVGGNAAKFVLKHVTNALLIEPTDIHV